MWRPQRYLFHEDCFFEIIMGFPNQGVQCSIPLSERGRNLFSIRMPIMTAFEEGTFYAANIYPLRNPFPGSHEGPLDDQPWRIDIVTTDGTTVEETARNIPMGPELPRGLATYPSAMFDPVAVPSVRTPSSLNAITLQFRLGARIYIHGERMLVTAPFGYRWRIGGAVSLASRSAAGDVPVELAALIYDSGYPPVAEPHNQIELTLADPDVAAGTDLAMHGSIYNAAIDPLLNEDVRSANIWMIQMYEPGAGYLKFAFRHQAVVFEGFPLQAITGGTITPWLPFNTRSATAIMVTFRLGTALIGEPDRVPMLELVAPQGFYVPTDCFARRISALHLEVDGYLPLPAASITQCYGGGEETEEGTERIAKVSLSVASALIERVLYAFQFELIIPSILSNDNTWSIRSWLGIHPVEEQLNIPGFKLGEPFLSALYHPGTVDTGEDLWRDERGLASNLAADFCFNPEVKGL